MAKTRILILGGTLEARQLAGELAGRADLDVTLSMAGRTEKPVAHPVPVRIGGFGGADGLARHLRDNAIDILVDATHPYAAQMSRNATEAAAMTGVPLLALRRPAWEPSVQDNWEQVTDAGDALRRLSAEPKRVFVTLGRNDLVPLETAPQHLYWVRSVDPVDPPLALPNASYIVARGPFTTDDEYDLLARHDIEAIICKNSGGAATYNKLIAARELGIRVLMIQRPPLPDVESASAVSDLVAMLDHRLASLKKRGV